MHRVAAVPCTILESLQPMFRTAKLEGDAVFAIEAVEIEAGAAVVKCVRTCAAGILTEPARPSTTQA